MKTEDTGPSHRLFYSILPIAIVATLYAFSMGSTVVLWIICSFFLFALIDPWMQKFTGKGVSPIFLAIGLVVIAFVLVSGMGFLVFRTSSGIFVRLMSYKTAIFKLYEDANHYLTHWTQLFSHPHDSALLDSAPSMNAGQNAAHGAAQAAGQASAGGASAAQAAGTGAATSGSGGAANASVSTSEVGMGVLSGLNSVLSVLTFVTLTPLLTFFMIAERDQFGMVATQLFQTPGKGKLIWKQVTDAINAYFLGNLVLIAVSFPIFVLAFALLHVKAFLSLGLLSAIMNLVPFLGFILASILPTLDFLMNGGHAGSAIALVALCFVTHFTVANVVTPKLLGAKLDLNATISTIALIGWGELWGPLGLLLAIPFTALIKIMLQHSSLTSFQALAAMMSEDPKSLQKRGMTLVSERLKLKKK
jgi:predicted PurR-regulated permease PerM